MSLTWPSWEEGSAELPLGLPTAHPKKAESKGVP